MYIRRNKVNALIERWADAVADLAAVPYEGDKRDAQARIDALQGAINEAAGTPELRAIEEAQMAFEDKLGVELRCLHDADSQQNQDAIVAQIKNLVASIHTVKVPE